MAALSPADKDAAMKYWQANVMPTLRPGILELANTRPADPLKWLSDWYAASPTPVDWSHEVWMV